MNVQTQIVRELSSDDVHILRSKLIDKAAAFEAELHRVAATAGVKLASKATLGQRIDALQAALQAKVQLDKHDKRIASIIEEAEPLMVLRNELAHGVMRLVKIDGEIQIVVSNANRALEPIRLFAHLGEEDFKTAARNFASLSNRLKQIVEKKSA